MTYELDYAIRRNPAELDSTGYMEIGPGRYSGEHWQDGFLFVCEDAFAMAEGILAKHFRDYDHFAMNEIPREVGLRVIDEWRGAARSLPNSSTSQALSLLNTDAAFRINLESLVDSDRHQIAQMLRELSSECTSFYESHDWVCVLGM
ncbi:MAG: hypothetical protein AB7Q37_04135 [Pyrinomonadaceae bacterium]